MVQDKQDEYLHHVRQKNGTRQETKKHIADFALMSKFLTINHFITLASRIINEIIYDEIIDDIKNQNRAKA